MCMACEESDFYDAYLDAVEEAKRKAQPWQCEVTIFAADDAPSIKPAAAAASSPFACDETE